ncbi:hypothetical protein G4T80_002781 [Listeria innocua]|nr:hypothetical protein [Listeria innocua]EED2113496.1 hypothetical protein [Listeria innocua]
MSKINKLITLATIFILLVSNLGNSLQVIAETIDSSIAENTNTVESEEDSNKSEETVESSIIEENNNIISSEIVEDDSEQDNLNDNSLDTHELEERINSSTRASFSPPARGDVGYEVRDYSSTSTEQRRNEIKNNEIPRRYGEELSITIDEELGREVGDTIEFEISKESKVHLWWQWYASNQKESYYGFITLKNVVLSSDSTAISTSIKDVSNGAYKVTVTRKIKDDLDSYNLKLSYDYEFTYYTSYFFSQMGGWSEWNGITTENIKSVSTAVPIKVEEPKKETDWGNSIVFGTRQEMDNDAKPFKTASTLTLNNNSGNLSITNNVGNAAGSDGTIPAGLTIDFGQSREALNASLYSISSSNYLTDSNNYLVHSATGQDSVSDTVNTFPSPKSVKQGDILRAYSNVTLSDRTSAARIRHMEGTSEYNDVKEGQNEVFYQITNNGYEVLHFNHLDNIKKFEIATSDTQETLERKLANKEFLVNGNYSSVEIVKFSEYPDNSKAGSTTGKIQVREKLVNGQYVFYDYEVKFEVKEDRVITADGVPTSIPLGTNFDNVSPYDLVKDVKLGNLSLAKDEYQVSVQNTVSTDTVKDKTAKVLVTYKKDTSKTLSLDVPVKVLWGNSVVFGGYDYDGSGRTTAAFTLNTESSPFITATQGGTRDDNLAIHSNFANKQYYTFNWFDLSNKKSILMTEDNMGTKYLKANGKDLKKDKLKEWGTNQIQEVNYGDIVRAWQLESNKNWLYEDEIRNSYNMRKNSVYYEITQTGYKPLFVNQANINKRTISIDETDKEIENKIEESIELPDGTNAKFIEYPSREKQGESNGIIRVSQTLASGKTIEYDYTAPFEVINDRLVVDTKEADVLLGTDINLTAPSTFIDSVKLGDQKLTNNDYKVEYVTKFDTSIIGNPQVSLKITLNSDSNKFVEVTSKANVKYGSTIISRAYDTKDVDVSVSLLDNNGVPYLNANQGFGFSDYGGLLSRPNMSIYRDGEYNQILSVGYGTVKNNPEKLAEIWNQRFDKVDLEYGDVVRYYVCDYGNNTNSKGKNTWISRNESLVRETEGYYEAYYELTTSGYRLMNINQLEVNNSNKVSLNTSKEEMDKNILSYINIPSHISNPQDYRMEFQNVDASSSGKKTSTINVYQKLQSGGEFMTTYSVNYTVNPEIEETSYDVEGNQIVETKKTSFDYGTQFKPSPTKYLEKDDNLYVYKGWLENTEEPGVDVPKEGIPSPAEKESKFYYIYEKADKYINVTIPTEMVFGTFDNTEEVKSNKYEIKNNSKELTTSVTLDSFESVSTSVKLLGENDEPEEKIDSARLNLLINDEPKIKGFNETKSDIELANIEPKNKITIGINGEYYDKTSKTNIVEYNTTLKFKAISGN